MAFRSGVLFLFVFSSVYAAGDCPLALQKLAISQISIRTKWTPLEIEQILSAVEQSWSLETSADSDWNSSNPANGQCAVTALVVQDFLGGGIVNGSWELHGKKISHYWNQIDDLKVDLTAKQFPLGVPVERGVEKKGDFASTRAYILSFPATVERYLKLKEQVLRRLKNVMERPNLEILSYGPLPAYIEGFDIDDTVLSLPTPILIFHKTDGSSIEIKAERYREELNRLGKEGVYIDHEVRRFPRVSGTFKYFGAGDEDSENYFLKYLKLAVESGSVDWQLPMWAQFVKAMSTYDTAQFTKLITARGHPSKHILEGLNYLRDQKIIRFVPLLKNIDPLAYKIKATDTYSRPKAKAIAIARALDEFQEFRDARSKIILSYEWPIFWEFFDDDIENISSMGAAIDEGRLTRRWAGIIAGVRLAIK